MGFMQGEPNTEQVPNHAYVIAPNYRLVSLDQTTRQLFPHAQIGDHCFSALQGLSDICDECPWKERLESGINQAVIFNHRLNTWVDLSYMTLEWPDHGECILMNGRGIDQIPNLLYLFNKQTRYDKLAEMNLTKDSFKILFLEQDKYTDFPPIELSKRNDRPIGRHVYPSRRQGNIPCFLESRHPSHALPRE